MHLLQSGTDLAVIALWLGHSSPAVTHQYLEADLAAKEKILRRLTDPNPTPTRFHPGDQLLAFLEGLRLCTVQRHQISTPNARHPVNFA